MALDLHALPFCVGCENLFWNGEGRDADLSCFECMQRTEPKLFAPCLCCRVPLLLEQYVGRALLCYYCQLGLERMKQSEDGEWASLLETYISTMRKHSQPGDFIALDTKCVALDAKGKPRPRIILQLLKKPPHDLPADKLFPGFYLLKDGRWSHDLRAALDQLSQ